MAFIGPAQDRMVIRELYDSYADAVIRMDRAAWLECWREDAVWTTHDYFSVAGREAVAQKCDELLRDVATATFFTQVCAIEADGDRAAARVICLESLILANGGGYDLTGRFDDRLRREGGVWRFESREYRVLTKQERP